MIYIESNQFDPCFNLALEQYLFDCMDAREQYFMLWQNNPTVVVGRYQNTEEEINREFVDSHNIQVVRRLSGGGAVYHDSGNLNFSFIVNQDDISDFNFCVFVQPVIQTLADFGITASFTGRNDIVIDGKKFSGNSQYAKNGRLLHHGCIMLDSDVDTVQRVLRVRDAKFSSKSIKSVSSRITTINANLSHPITMDTFRKSLKDHVFDNNPFTQYQLTENDLQHIEKIQDKYASWDWTYGKSPPFNMKRERKFPFGLLSIHLYVNAGRIQSIRIYGDFFGNGDISALESSLVGLPLNKQLETTLRTLPVSSYINGITAKDLYELIMY